MKNIKSHFVLTKQQRSGVFVLILLIVILQCVYFFVDFSTDELNLNDREKINAFQKEIDSLALIRQYKKYEIKPYNPNFITDYKGYVLGMTVEEIDRLHQFRELNKYVNSAKEFQQVTKVSDSLLHVLSPKFKFPDWVTNKSKSIHLSSSTYQKDINKAEARDLHRATSIEYKLAYRVVNYREKLGGFLAMSQLYDVYDLSEEDVKKIQGKFELKSIPDIQKININLATVTELTSLGCISDYLAANIVEERTLREGFKSLDELKYVDKFPVDKLERIKLYLTLN